MKIPFRYQATNYDCVPTTFINALQYLFEREDLPPEVIHKVMQYSLDSINKRGELGRGTTGLACQLILQWVESYKPKDFKNFSINYRYLQGEDVHLKQNNIIVSCLNRSSVALLRLCNNRAGSVFHYALALNADAEYLYFFDPYYRVKNFSGDDAKAMDWLGDTERVGFSKCQSPNLRIRRERLDSEKYEKYSMGPIEERECCLIERT
jgi:hypothetical protein